VEPPLANTSLLGTQTFSPKLVISIQFDLCNQDTSQLMASFVSTKGVVNREVLLLLDIFCIWLFNPLRTDGDFCHQGRDTEIAQNIFKLSKPTDMTTHWKGLGKHFLMVPLADGTISSLHLVFGE
jgi:hypothetical protein